MRIWLENKYQNINAVIFIVYILVLLVVLIAGCQVAQRAPQTKVWGQGDLPADWQGFFGEDNVARLDYVQTQTINKMGQAIAELAVRVRKLEADPNDAKPKKKG
jgi:outer membrane murein-binding lipoprotein Lpp